MRFVCDIRSSRPLVAALLVLVSLPAVARAQQTAEFEVRDARLRTSASAPDREAPFAIEASVRAVAPLDADTDTPFAIVPSASRKAVAGCGPPAAGRIFQDGFE